jgi:CheY-like chemotaxis protein
VTDPSKTKSTKSSAPGGWFGEVAVRLARNPLGIIALFIVLIYGVAALVTAVPSNLTPAEREPLIIFLVVFPVLVLAVFSWIVVFRPGNLFSPQDFRDEENYVALVASITAATIRRPDGTTEQNSIDVHKIVETTKNLVPVIERRSSAAKNIILWVDDRPENNTFERQAFEALGVNFTLALTTDQALDLTKTNRFAAVISDMGRKEGPREGYKLLGELRNKGNETPFFVYAGSNSPEHRKEAAKLGAQGSTNDPQELIQMVTATILRA